MDKAQVQDILDRRAFPGSGESAKLVETHISWVILTPDFAFKIKKPVRFDFLDFSTLSLRKKYCKEELRLNRRLAPDTYLGVLPIGKKDGKLQFGEALKRPMDYAVWMRREADERQLDRLLEKGKVQPDDLRPLAHQLAVFHRKHALRNPRFYPAGLVADFADLFHHEKALTVALGSEVPPTLATMRKELPKFIAQHSGRLRARAKSGLWVDGHGDLHARNIFLTEPPIVFDCIEFAPQLRRLDVLNELAFLCMDFDHHGRPDLGAAFLQYYQQEHPCITLPEDELLFQFFKAYRANVRLKVELLGGAGEAVLAGYWRAVRGYWSQVELG